MTSGLVEVEGYALDTSRRYDPERHLWLQTLEGELLRIGMDPLGVETTGDLVQLVIPEVGVHLSRGSAFGSVEAAKFVGPLSMPVSGTIAAVNPAVLADPRLVAEDPLGAGWLIKIVPTDPSEFRHLIEGEAIVDWFHECVVTYRREGVLAE